MMFRTHTQTGGSTLTAQQPENNIVRTAIEALSATGVDKYDIPAFLRKQAD